MADLIAATGSRAPVGRGRCGTDAATFTSKEAYERSRDTVVARSTCYHGRAIHKAACCCIGGHCSQRSRSQARCFASTQARRNSITR